MFDEIDNETFAEREERILAFWKEEEIFHKSLAQRKEAPYYTFYDGPPFATGLPHYGHLLAGTLKDVVPRYKTMKGYYVPRRFGWDTHGLPIENIVEKKHNLSGAPSIQEFGIDKFNEECRSNVKHFVKEWQVTVERMGRWVDFERTWTTMDVTYMESVWWVFQQLYQKGLVYEGYKVMPFSAELGTPLSNFEAGENYKEVDDPSLVVKLQLRDEPDTHLLIWTTTPWTLISNMAATVREDITYLKVQHEGVFYILAKEALSRWFKEGAEVIGEFQGKELIGKRYEPLFRHFADKEAFYVIGDDFVSTDDGTGIVHTAPAFGETDFYACQKAGLPLVCPVDHNGRFTSQVPEYEGLFVKDADKGIIQQLKKEGRLFYRGTIRHRYPFCWRSDTPLIYKAVTTWFVSVEKIKDSLVAANQEVHWMPEHLKEGRFGKWLEGARDWAVSRNRYWGTPIPLWRADDGEIHVVGSIKELETLTGEKVEDVHRHYIDHLTFEKGGKTFRRISEVFDCWFDTGSMPYAQNHYPFETGEHHFPADFIAEGADQTRGWFYTLMVLGVALLGRSPYKNVIVNGILLAEDGNKMSKRLKNYPEPTLMIDKYGADAVRLYMLHSPAVKGDDLRFCPKGVELVLRQILIPFWNAHAFFVTYANIYKWSPTSDRGRPSSTIDRWIIAKLHQLIQAVERGMDIYDLSLAVEPFVGFIDDLTNWYIRRSRRRFWSDQDTSDRREAFETLHYTLVELCKIAAPFIPFLSDAIYQRLTQEKASVHLEDFPRYDGGCREEVLEKGMDALQVAVSLGHALRKEQKLKVRQPLPSVHIVATEEDVRAFLAYQEHLIADELNVKRVHIEEERQKFVKLSIKPNFRVLGKKVGKHMKEAQLLISELPQDQIAQMVLGHPLLVKLGGEAFTLESEDVEITREVHEGIVAMNAGTMTVALETELTEELILEGLAREIINKINTMRREAGFAVTDRVVVKLGATEKVQKALRKHGEYVMEEVLAVKMDYTAAPQSTKWDINGEPTAIYIEKA